MVRDGLIRLISQQTDLACCGEAATGPETHAAVDRLKPDLVILDLRLKQGDGIELIKSLKAQHADLRILILSQHEAPIYVERALRAGALGYVIKEQAADEVLKAIRSVLAGDIYLTRGMAALLLRKLVGPTPPQEAGKQSLTDRELTVLQLLGTGLSTREIASQLNVSFKTIETHRENIKRKLSIRTAPALVHYATEWAREQVSVPNTGLKPAKREEREG
jgi:DNA-binding NarL/FixJ family response regulator